MIYSEKHILLLELMKLLSERLTACGWDCNLFKNILYSKNKEYEKVINFTISLMKELCGYWDMVYEPIENDYIDENKFYYRFIKLPNNSIYRKVC